MRAAIPVYSVNIAAVVAVQAALADPDHLEDYLRQIERIEGAAVRRLRSTGTEYWKSDANFVLVRAGDRPDALVKGAARSRHLHPRPLVRARLRRLPPHRHRASSSTHAAASRRWKRSCAPRRNRPPDEGNADRRAPRARRQGPIRRSHGHPVSGSHARALRAPRRVRPPHRGRRRSRRRSAPHRRGSRHRARRGGVEGGRHPARHQSRRLFRDADGRDAGGRGDRSRRTAACRRRSKVRVARVGDLQTELVHDFFDGFALGARANVHVKVLYGRSSHHHVEAVFKAFARALRVACSKDKQLARMLPSTKGLL